MIIHWGGTATPRGQEWYCMCRTCSTTPGHGVPLFLLIGSEPTNPDVCRKLSVSNSSSGLQAEHTHSCYTENTPNAVLSTVSSKLRELRAWRLIDPARVEVSIVLVEEADRRLSRRVDGVWCEGRHESSERRAGWKRRAAAAELTG